MSGIYNLYLVTYDRGKDLHGIVKPYHWAFFIATSADGNAGIFHQLHGMPGGFYYIGAEQIPNVSKYGPLLHQVEIGQIPKDRLDSVEGLLKGVPIVKDEASDWNCQSWSKDSFTVLKEQEWVYMDFEALRNWVKEP